LDLPLDHFRLLGVNPATDAQTVLRTLQIRLDRPPEQGYTVETLQARADLLRASADLLSDPDRRQSYESDLTALLAAEEPLMPALEIPSSREVAGLLLLLEAGQPAEAFQLASRALQPPQAPALGSSREADLTLLAGEAALAACEEQSRERHYEQAARTLQQGLQLLQRMGQLPELRERMHAELESLTPFRVLDLLSRDPASGQERDEGLTLLDQLVQRRGGLEGERDAGFAAEDFQTFFKQIRSFLTVQEQLDLFQRWGREGSPAAAFLATIALTASGFASASRNASPRPANSCWPAAGRASNRCWPISICCSAMWRVRSSASAAAQAPICSTGPSARAAIPSPRCVPGVETGSAATCCLAIAISTPIPTSRPTSATVTFSPGWSGRTAAAAAASRPPPLPIPSRLCPAPLPGQGAARLPMQGPRPTVCPAPPRGTPPLQRNRWRRNPCSPGGHGRTAAGCVR